MPGAVSKAWYKSSLLLPGVVCVLLPALEGAGRASEARVDGSFPTLEKSKNQATTSENQRPADPQVKAVLDKMAAAGIGQPATVSDVRKAYDFYPKLSGTPEKVFRIEDRQIAGPAGNIAIRVYIPLPTTGLPILVFFHGGGFVAGSLATHDTPLRSMANRCECIVVSAAYRLAPENKYPAAPEDAYAATKWSAEHAKSIGGDPRRIAVGGDGAGGNLAAVVTLMARERGTPSLLFQLLIYPALDASTMSPIWWAETNAPAVSRESMGAIMRAYLPITGQLSDPFVSPIRADNLRNLPPALVIAYGGDDPLRVEGEEYARRLRQDGVAAKVSLYPNAVHGFFLMAGDLDAGKRCIDEAASALRNTFSPAS